MPLHGHQKLRIKVPKSLVVTKIMHRKCQLHIKVNNANSSDKGNLSTRVKRGNQFQRELVVKYPSKSKGKKNEPNCDLEDGKDSKECHIFTTNKAFSSELGNNVVFVDNEPDVATLSQIVRIEEKFEPNKSKEEKKKGSVRRMKNNLLSFLDEKKKGWNDFIKAKKRKNNGFHSDEVYGDGVVTRFKQAKRRRKKASLWRMIRIPSRILVVRLKLKMIKSLMMKKKVKVTKQCEQGGHEEGVSELCKKRILMGAKCKPLSSSGTLRYDKDGRHLPEIVP